MKTLMTTAAALALIAAAPIAVQAQSVDTNDVKPGVQTEGAGVGAGTTDINQDMSVTAPERDANAVKPGLQIDRDGMAADEGADDAATGGEKIGEIETPDISVTTPTADATEVKPGLQTEDEANTALNPEGTAGESVAEIEVPDIEVTEPTADQSSVKPGLQLDHAAMADMDEATLKGADVIDANNEDIGEFVTFIASEGARTEAVLDVGGFLGLGEHRVAVPLDMVTFEQKDGEMMVYVKATAEELKDMPAVNS